MTMKSISSIELLLTKNIRRFLTKRFSIHVLKQLSFFISLVSCLCASSVMLFSLYTPSLQKYLNYTQFQINTITSLSAVGMYLFLPVLGYLADSHGPVLLALISISLFAPSYYVAALAFQNGWNYWIMGFTFMFTGIATSALYFSSLLTCAKIYPNYKGMSISAPVSCYGLSSLIGSQLLKSDKFKIPHTNDLDLYVVFISFSCIYIFTGIMNWVASSIVAIEADLIYSDEETPLIQNEEDLEAVRSVEPPQHKTRFVHFLQDKSAWLLILSLFLNVGPLEMFNNNIGSIIKTIDNPPSITTQVSYYAFASTIIRLMVGGLSDYLSNSRKICRVWLLLLIIFLGLIGQILSSLNIISIDDGKYFAIVTILNGLSYGGLFTIYPTVVASIWGVDILGSTWGAFMPAAAIGSISFSLLYGKRFDKYCMVRTSEFEYSNCLSPFFNLTALSFVISLAIVWYVWRFIWVKRGFVIF